MYIPNHFKVEDQAILHEFMKKHSFATLITHHSEVLVSHLPFVVRTNPQLILISHLARANRQWESFEHGSEVLVICQGPQAFISPSLYEDRLSVPTWNYSVVHAYGRAFLREDVEAVLEERIKLYDEPYLEQWNSLPGEYRERMKKGIMALEIRVSRLEGKFKMSQNRP